MARLSDDDGGLPGSVGEVEELLAELEAEEREISARRRRLFDRIDRAPDAAAVDSLREQERAVSDERRRLHARIDELRAHRSRLRADG